MGLSLVRDSKGSVHNECPSFTGERPFAFYSEDQLVVLPLCKVRLGCLCDFPSSSLLIHSPLFVLGTNDRYINDFKEPGSILDHMADFRKASSLNLMRQSLLCRVTHPYPSPQMKKKNNNKQSDPPLSDS